jgi:hypothetical protein
MWPCRGYRPSLWVDTIALIRSRNIQPFRGRYDTQKQETLWSFYTNAAQLLAAPESEESYGKQPSVNRERTVDGGP